MNFSFNSFISIIALSLAASLLTACEEYEPPAQADLVRSGAGAYTVGQPISMNFSQAVVPESLEITLWPAARGTRRVPADGVEPIIGPCSIDKECDGIKVEFDDDRLQANFDIDDTLAGPGATFVLEILPGLAGDNGRITGASYLYTVRYRATFGNPDANIQFDDGIYILGGSVNHPMRAVLTLVTHIKILSDGRFAMAAAKGDVDEEEVADTSRDPRYITVDDTADGWTIFANGLVVENDAGDRFLETEVFDVDIPVLGGSLFLEMSDVRLFAEIKKDGDGNDFIDGTLTYEKLTLINTSNGNESEYEGDSTELLGDFVPENLVPAGALDMCDDICGAVTSLCNPPADFPHPDFCEESTFQ